MGVDTPNNIIRQGGTATVGPTTWNSMRLAPGTDMNNWHLTGGMSWPTLPREAMFYGGSNGYRVGFRSPPAIFTTQWRFPIDDRFTPGNFYYISFERIWAIVSRYYHGEINTQAAAAITISLVDTTLNEVGAYRLLMSAHDWPANLNPSTVEHRIDSRGTIGVAMSADGPTSAWFYTSTSDAGISIRFRAQEGYELILMAQTSASTGPSGLVSINAAAPINTMLSFEGFRVTTTPPGPDLDEEFRDEQRGFWGRVLDWFQRIYDAIMSIPEVIRNLPQMILDGIRSLFVPEEGAIQEIIDDFMEFAEARLGFIYQIFTLVPRVVQPLTASGGDGDVVMEFPAIELPAFAGGRTLLDRQPFNLTAVVRSSPAMGAVYDIFRVLASVLLFGLLLRYLYKVAYEVLGKDSDAS